MSRRVSLLLFPLILLVLAILAYGTILHRLGFYWDDWPWIWYAHTIGARGLLDIDQISRPLAGEILWLGYLLAGESPLSWQILHLIYRCLAGLALFWMLVKLFPKHQAKSVWVALLWMVYPGFRQQFVSVNTIRHMLPLAVLFISFSLMIWALRVREETHARKNFNYLMIGSLVTAGLVMLSTEYFYGLEFIRPVLIFLALDGVNSRSDRLKKTFLSWLPYFVLVLVVFSWRYLVSPTGNYPITMGEEFVSQPARTVVDVVASLMNGFIVSLGDAWGNLFQASLFRELGLRIPLIYAMIVLGSFFLVGAYLLVFPADGNVRSFWKVSIPLGLYSILVANLPFLLTGLSAGVNFPFDRLLLPMMLGASLVVAGIIDLVGLRRNIKIFLVCGIIAFSTGMHYLHSITYQRDWEAQKSFYNQLLTRMPGLKNGTTIIYEHSKAFDNFRSTDNSLIPVLNWIYSPELSGDILPVNIADLRLRQNLRASEIHPGMSVLQPYGPFTFEGTTDEFLVIQFAPPWCVQVLAPELSGLYPNLPEYLPRLVDYSNLDQINDAPEQPARLPDSIFGSPDPPGWCQYYQEASLAADQGDWDKVVSIGEKAFALVDPPKQPTERIPFIMGYAMTGDWERAETLTLDTRRRDANSEELLCVTWEKIQRSAPVSPERDTLAQRFFRQYSCSEW